MGGLVYFSFKDVMAMKITGSQIITGSFNVRVPTKLDNEPQASETECAMRIMATLSKVWKSS